jgi:DNA-binding transcriptional LysR family regulator
MITLDYQIELRHYRYFLALASELNFHRAADLLNISQPGLSRQIKQMEERIGAALFYRNQRVVKLTKAGEYLKIEAEYILNHLDITHRQIRQIDAGQLGEIRIGFIGSAMQRVVPNILLNLNTTYPDIHTTLEEMSNSHQVEALLADQLDIGFVRLPNIPGELSKEDIHVDHFTLVLPDNHHLDASNFSHIQQVEDEQFILFSSDYSPHYYQTIISIFQDAGFEPRISHKSVHAQTIFKLVEQGLGLAIIPHSLQYGFDLKIKFLDIPMISQTTTLSAIWKNDNRNTCLPYMLAAMRSTL